MPMERHDMSSEPCERVQPAMPPPGDPSVERRETLQAVLALAERCSYEREHTHQVTRLALALFDELRSLHGLGPTERFWLHCAGLLHDVGVARGAAGHHKTALKIILRASELPLDPRERLAVASIARYHRKSLPSERHGHFAALDPTDRGRVAKLAGLLRVADGLDRSHLSLVRELACQATPDRVIVRCRVAAPLVAERAAALEKGDLFERVYHRKLFIETAA